MKAHMNDSIRVQVTPTAEQRAQRTAAHLSQTCQVTMAPSLNKHQFTINVKRPNTMPIAYWFDNSIDMRARFGQDELYEGTFYGIKFRATSSIEFCTDIMSQLTADTASLTSVMSRVAEVWERMQGDHSMFGRELSVELSAEGTYTDVNDSGNSIFGRYQDENADWAIYFSSTYKGYSINTPSPVDYYFGFFPHSALCVYPLDSVYLHAHAELVAEHRRRGDEEVAILRALMDTR